MCQNCSINVRLYTSLTEGEDYSHPIWKVLGDIKWYSLSITVISEINTISHKILVTFIGNLRDIFLRKSSVILLIVAKWENSRWTGTELSSVFYLCLLICWCKLQTKEYRCVQRWNSERQSHGGYFSHFWVDSNFNSQFNYPIYFSNIIEE